MCDEVGKQDIRKGNFVMTAQKSPCRQPNNGIWDDLYRPLYKIVNKMFAIGL